MIKFHTNDRPTGGNIQVTPSIGVECETLFLIETSDFNDTDSERDFKYKFGFRIFSTEATTWFYDGCKLFYVFFLYFLMVVVRVNNTPGLDIEIKQIFRREKYQTSFVSPVTPCSCNYFFLFVDTESNGLMRAPFPAGDNSRKNFIDIVVRAYDEHGAYVEKWTSVKVFG